MPVEHRRGEFLSNIFLVPKKEGLNAVGQRPVINLKELNMFLACNHFKMEGLTCLKDILAHGDFMCKDRLEGCIFQRTSCRELMQICTFYLGRRALRIEMFMFRTGPSTTIFYKTVEGPYGPVETSSTTRCWGVKRHLC